jgi:hypothetical protein
MIDRRNGWYDREPSNWVVESARCSLIACIASARLFGSPACRSAIAHVRTSAGTGSATPTFAPMASCSGPAAPCTTDARCSTAPRSGTAVCPITATQPLSGGVRTCQHWAWSSAVTPSRHAAMCRVVSVPLDNPGGEPSGIEPNFGAGVVSFWGQDFFVVADAGGQIRTPALSRCCRIACSGTYSA